jgi:hypothetical protein
MAEPMVALKTDADRSHTMWELVALDLAMNTHDKPSVLG